MAFVTDLLFLKILYVVFGKKKALKRWFIIFTLIFWAVIGVWILSISLNHLPDYAKYGRYFEVVAGVFALYIPKAVTAFLGSIPKIPALFAKRFSIRKKRSHFALFSLLVGAMVTFFMIDGIFFGKYRYTPEVIVIESEKIPPSFDGFRIVQLSDFHLGSFRQPDLLAPAIDMTNAMRPDLVLFTGDMINARMEEAVGWFPLLNRIQAKYGCYSVTGNHELGDFSGYGAIQADTAIISGIGELHAALGFTLLPDTCVYLKKGIDSIAIVGVHNCGRGRFRSTGNLKKVVTTLSPETFSILLSHDPLHWKSEVLPESSIDLTLSGHTHAAQMGIDLPWFKWSPVSLMYPRWAGLYECDGRWLYVHRGTGFIGFSGRVGMTPEVTLIILKHKKPNEAV
ncbi:MAG: metallophosphoesterase [Bacteroidetes bacterium]|nr:metallophosphoesterase [Bacteroidota bacterium]MBU1720340.1 metallophosphoesterase [Bacteroidota bacterium]